MSPKPTVLEFPVIPGIEKIVTVVGNTPDSFFLDSADQTHPTCNFSYAALTSRHIVAGNDNPWPALEKIYREISSPIETNVPFCGGLAGYVGYEEGYRFGLYDSVLVFDHRANQCFLTSWKLSPKELKTESDHWMHLLESAFQIADNSPRPPLKLRGGEGGVIKIPWSFDRYREKIKKIKDYLIAGDVYQINLTGRFEAETTRLASSIYKQLRKISPAPYSAFLNTGEMQILSASPECFFEINGEQIVTRPIKGTRKRDSDPKKDQKFKTDLLSSEKDRAELLMIIDLERNDLGKICHYGSVAVDSLFAVETFAQVHHLVATVSGKLKPGITPIDALKALFPGGSVTGAPKIRAMEIIQDLEETPRSVYTGALGYIGAGGRSLFNIPIRTLTKTGQKVCFHAGGGIVIDSDPLAEYEEMMVKAEGMIQSLT